MESLLMKFKSLIGTYNDDEYYDEEENSMDEPEQKPVLKVVSGYREEESRSNLVRKPSRDSYMHVDYRPHRFEDMEHVVNVLDAGKSVILHLDGIDERLCQRVLDFASGVVCTMKCISAMPNDYVCILIPCVADMFRVDGI